jgi:L-iditol 2-dehydrogenase
MLMASICGTDLHYVYHGWPRNNWPLAPGEPGHEGVGVVVDGGGTQFEPGQRVLTVPNIWEARNFADLQTVSTHFLIPLPENIEIAHLLMTQQLGTVIFAARELPKLSGETVVVIGQGSAGLFHDFWLRRLGAGRIITIEPNRERRQAGRMFDVDDTVDVTGQAAVDAVLDLTDGTGADVVVDAVGGAETLGQAVRMAKAKGHVHIFGLPNTHDLVPFDLGTFFLKRLNATTTFGAQDEPGLVAFRQALEIIQRGEIDMTPFVTHVFDLEHVNEAFALAHEPSGGALKVSLTME